MPYLAQKRLAALERQLTVAVEGQDHLRRRLDKFEAVLRAVGQTAPNPPDDDEVAVIRLARPATCPSQG